MTPEMTPAQAFKARLLAKKEAEQGGIKPVIGGSQYELMINQLAQYKRRLKSIKSTQAKETAKRDEILPELRPYVDGVLEAATGQQDDVLIYYMIWSLDAGDVDECLRIAAYAFEHGLVMPDVFARDLADWTAEEIAVRTIKAHEKGEVLDNSSFTAWSLVKEADMVDEVAAKLHKAMGLVLHTSEPEKALHHYRQAVELWERVGAKKLINELEKVTAGQ